jgi:hypothetical protein
MRETNNTISLCSDSQDCHKVNLPSVLLPVKEGKNDAFSKESIHKIYKEKLLI